MASSLEDIHRMSISVVCGNCGKRLRAGQEHRGRRGRCPFCGLVVEIPSENQSAADVFISYSSHDLAAAERICSALEKDGISCWMAPRDILPGTDYGEAIMDAITSCRMVVLVFSAAANDSPQVKREIERAASKNKVILPFRLDTVTPTRAMEYFLSAAHWLDASQPPVEAHVQRLVQTVRAQRAARPRSTTSPASQPIPNPAADRGSPPVRAVESREVSPIRDRIQEWRAALKAGELVVALTLTDTGERVRQLADVLIEDLRQRGFSEDDRQKTRVVLDELLSNVRHVPDPVKLVSVRIYYVLREVCVEVEDRGPGFDLRVTMRRLLDQLDQGEREHGLLRARRYGTRLCQSEGLPHRITWTRQARPASVPSLFDQTENVVPIVFDFAHWLVRVSRDIYLFEEYLRNFPTDAARSFVFEPLRRTSAAYIGLEIRGSHPSGDGELERFLAGLWRYRKHHVPEKQVIVFADAELEDHSLLRALCEGAITPRREVRLSRYGVAADFAEMCASGAFRFFEIREACLDFLSTVRKPS
jgi:anti-sigma regulatory factor (Ser/Thr protein kinase)